MQKINFLSPDKNNLYTYLYTGIFLFLVSVFDVSLNSFLSINLTSFLPGSISFILPLFLGFIGLHLIRIEYSGIKFLDLDSKIQKILKSTDFEILKKEEEKKGFKEATNGPFFRSGKKNQWKNILTISQKNKILNEFKEIIETFNYL